MASVPQFHDDAEQYLELVREEVPAYDDLQDAVVSSTLGVAARRILDLGVGSGETAARVLDAHPDATLVGVDASGDLLALARTCLPASRVRLEQRRMQDPLPAGPFDLVVSALAVHHLSTAEKADLLTRLRDVLADGGRVVVGDVVVPEDPADAEVPLEPGVDLPETLGDLLGVFAQAGLDPAVTWSRADLAVVAAERSEPETG